MGFPDLILEEILLIIGHSSLESLDSCRQVCRAWNNTIMRNILKNPTKKWGTVIQSRIERCWAIQGNYPSDKLISRAKLLGKQRHKILWIGQKVDILF